MVSVLFGCRGNKQDEIGVISIYIDTNDRTQTDISQFVDSIQLIQLETTEDNLIGSISKVFFDDQKIIIVDRSQHQVLIFRGDGGFVNKPYPVIYNYSNPHLQKLANNQIVLRDALFNDIYYHEGDSLRKVISYEIKNDNLLNFKGLTYTEEKYTKSCAYHEKGGYIFSSWYEGDQRFHTIFSKKDKKNILIYPEDVFWQSLSVVKSSTKLLIDNNRDDVLVNFASGSSILEYLENDNVPSEIKNKLTPMMANKTESEIMDMNPVLQLLYIKR